MYIEKLTGVYDAQLPNGIILSVGGVGYGLEMPLSALCQLPRVGDKLSLWTMTYVREDAIRLFGFLNYEDRMAFEVMLSLNGVGPKVALAILSTLTISAIRRAIQFNDSNILTSVPGVGPRLAEKLLVELRPKLERLSPCTSLKLDDNDERRGESDFDHIHPEEQDLIVGGRQKILDDVFSALENLGFKSKVITPIIKKVESGGFDTFQAAMRDALGYVNGRSEKEQSKKRKATKDILDQELF